MERAIRLHVLSQERGKVREAGNPLELRAGEHGGPPFRRQDFDILVIEAGLRAGRGGVSQGEPQRAA
jgi:hypothetical protein